MITIDHIVMAAETLDAGRAWLEDQLGVPAQGGGQHDLMGTHNALWRLGDAYLELIAIDPSAAAPARPRWFGLDAMGERLASGPRLVAWAARTDDLDAAIAASPVTHGKPVAMSRGDFAWRLTIPEDGTAPHDGQVPHLIAWDGPHPCERLEPSGLSLSRLVLRRDETATLAAMFGALGQPERVHVDRRPGAPSLIAEIMTDDGAIGLSG